MRSRKPIIASLVVPLFFGLSIPLCSQQTNSVPGASGARDPGVRAGSVNAGSPLSTLTSTQLQYFQDGLTRFQETDQVANGLGPTFNSTSCSGCHAQPAVGGTSPSTSQYPNIGPNPQIEAATANGATNRIPFFISSDGPVREARFPFVVNPNGAVARTPDGGVHALFTITGRADATGCSLAQPDFGQMQQLGNLIFWVPTPVFGAGLIENITDETILTNMKANANLKRQLGISGHPNYSGNDGSITRFDWKAQNKSLAVFAGEAHNVEIGVTNELFPDERANPPSSCLMNPTPEDSTNYDSSGAQIPSDVVQFANFMRFLAPPAPSSTGIPGNPPATQNANPQWLDEASLVHLLVSCHRHGPGDVAHSPNELDCSAPTALQGGPMVSTASIILGHGTNDSQKGMRIITTVLVAGGLLKSFSVPFRVIICCHLAMAGGTMAGGWRIIKTMGQRITKLTPFGGFAAETAGGLTIVGNAIFGIPVSTTHTITGAIVGVGASRRLTAVRWGITGRIVWAWLLTIPGAALLGAGLFRLLTTLMR